jgi:hypothetical protein
MPVQDYFCLSTKTRTSQLEEQLDFSYLKTSSSLALTISMIVNSRNAIKTLSSFQV